MCKFQSIRQILTNCITLRNYNTFQTVYQVLNSYAKHKSACYSYQFSDIISRRCLHGSSINNILTYLTKRRNTDDRLYRGLYR